VEEFKSEALQITKALSNQLSLLCHDISLALPLCEISSPMIDKSVDARQKLEQADETLTKFLSWQETKDKLQIYPKFWNRIRKSYSYMEISTYESRKGEFKMQIDD